MDKEIKDDIGSTATLINLQDRGSILRNSFLLYPGEASEVDYKAAMPFSRRDEFSLKLVKNIFGMANAGGGYLVIGFPENSSNHPEAGDVSEEILASYDVSDIAATAESFKKGTEKIDLKVHKDKHPINGKTYPIIEVGSFKSRPFFCKSSAGGILDEHALYIRVAAARTIKIATPDEWDQLIDICVAKRQDETLYRFGELLRQIGISPTVQNMQESTKVKFNKWIEDIREDAKSEAKNQGLKFEGFEIIHSVEVERTWTTKELLIAMQSAILNNTGWPIGYVFNNHPEFKLEPFKKGLKSVAVTTSSFDYWYIEEDGSFYFYRAFQEDGRNDILKDQIENLSNGQREIWFDSQIWRICEGLEHLVSLYRALEIDGTSKIEVRFNFIGINNRELCASPGTMRYFFPSSSGSLSEVKWEKDISLDVLAISIDQFTIEISNGLFEKFNFKEVSQEIINSIIEEYRGIRKKI